MEFPSRPSFAALAALFATLSATAPVAQEVERADGSGASAMALRAAPANYDFELKADLFALYEDGVIDTFIRQTTYRLLASTLERSLGFEIGELDSLHLAAKRDSLPDRGGELVVVLRGTEEVRTRANHPRADLFEQDWVVVDGKRMPDVSTDPVGLWSPAPGTLVAGDPAHLHQAASGAYRGGTPHEDLMILQAGRPAILQAAWRMDTSLTDGLLPFFEEEMFGDTLPFGARVRIERRDDGSYHLLGALRFRESGKELESLRDSFQAELEDEGVQSWFALGAPQFAAVRPVIAGNEIQFTLSFANGKAFAQGLTGPGTGGAGLAPFLLMTAATRVQQEIEVGLMEVQPGQVEVVLVAPEEAPVEEEPEEEDPDKGKDKGHTHKHKRP